MDALRSAGPETIDVGVAAELTSALVDLESVNPELDPNGSGESEIARFVVEWLSERGVEAITQPAAPGRPNVIARIPGSRQGSSLLLTGHLDTVPLAGPQATAHAHRDGDRIVGRGAYDMKGGIAAILLAAEWLRGAALAGDVVIGLVADEESHSRGTTALLDTVHADAAIVTEPTALDVVVAHKGFAWTSIETSGRAAHGSRPSEGRDAIMALAPMLARVQALGERLATEPDRGHPLLGHGSVHTSTVAGGTGYSTYPAACRLELERRTVPGESPERIAKEMEWILSAADGAPGVQTRWQLELYRPPFEVSEDAPLVRLVRAAAARLSDRPTRLIGYGPWTDAALLSAADIPTVVFGPGGAGAHSAREWVHAPDVARCAAVLTATACAFCGPTRRGPR